MCYQNALANIMPIDWLDPYGRTPMAPNAEMSVDITIVETDDGIKASSVKNPPSSGTNRIMNAIKNALGVDLCENAADISSQQADDLGKHKDDKDDKNDSSFDTGKSGLSQKGEGRSRQNSDGSRDTEDDKESDEDKRSMVWK